MMICGYTLGKTVTPDMEIHWFSHVALGLSFGHQLELHLCLQVILDFLHI